MFLAVNKFFCESTIHSLLHFTGDRKIYIKIIWLFALIVSFSFCCLRINNSFTKFLSREVSTSIMMDALDFEFPDVYICNENPISGSFSVTLSAENDDLLNKYKRLVNSSVVTTMNKDNWLEEFSLRMVNTLPYTFLSDVMGQQISQSAINVLIDDADKRGRLVTYRHNTFLNCMFMNLSDKGRDFLSSPSSRLSLTLFTDPPLPPPFDNSTQQDMFDSTNVKPFDWDVNYGYDYSRATGFRLFFTPQGHQPSEWSTQFVAGGHQRSEVVLEMEDVTSAPEDFVGQCLDMDSSYAVDYANPYNGEMETFKYELSACMHSEIARLSRERFNCSPNRYPLPWDYRALPSCYNLTAVSGQNLTDFYSNSGTYRNSLMAEVLTLCQGRAPCKRRFYTYRHYSTDWPSERLLTEFLMGFIANQMILKPVDTATVGHLPGIQFLLNSSLSDSKDRLLQVNIAALQDRSTETRLAIAYNFNSLIADAGGLLGLFLGMSLLSVLELVELLHDCALVGYKRFKSRLHSVAVSAVNVNGDARL